MQRSDGAWMRVRASSVHITHRPGFVHRQPIAGGPARPGARRSVLAGDVAQALGPLAEGGGNLDPFVSAGAAVELEPRAWAGRGGGDGRDLSHGVNGLD